MPIYTYRCESGHKTDKLQRSMISGVDSIGCPECTKDAQRLTAYAVQTVNNDHAAIPNSESEYQNESDRRYLKTQGWDGDRAVDHIRHNIVTDEQGNKRMPTT
ncbi:hypothetical protein LCGC14_0310720 [marine sediment metagenome]|uniref:Putative regulatory protein FmdB zinc ribbon domain-containing protein n=1 Tax=marine sediment metagenome TaxID=412755 RepID=A0A0F9TSG0_9ZZZZ